MVFHLLCRIIAHTSQIMMWHRLEFVAPGRLVDTAVSRLVIALIIAQIAYFIKAFVQSGLTALTVIGLTLIGTILIFVALLYSPMIQIQTLPWDDSPGEGSDRLNDDWWQEFKHPMIKSNSVTAKQYEAPFELKPTPNQLSLRDQLHIFGFDITEEGNNYGIDVPISTNAKNAIEVAHIQSGYIELSDKNSSKKHSAAINKLAAGSNLQMASSGDNKQQPSALVQAQAIHQYQATYHTLRPENMSGANPIAS